MSGHSHWAGIKHKKAKADKQRGKAFSRVSKQIMAAVRKGGKDPKANLELEYAIEAARGVSMPKDTIERAIAKAAGGEEGAKLETCRYEGYGPGGVAIMVDALTDNRNRTTPHIRRSFANHGGELSAAGAVAWTFEMKGLVLVPVDNRTEDEILEMALDAGADDVQPAGSVCEISCDPRRVPAVREALQKAGLTIESAEVTMVPKSYVDLDVETGRKVMKLMEALEDDEDVTNVFANFNLPDELVAELKAE
jgi:YebC/PmpR family DNA-binding regulatory protein